MIRHKFTQEEFDMPVDERPRHSAKNLYERETTPFMGVSFKPVAKFCPTCKEIEWTKPEEAMP